MRMGPAESFLAGGGVVYGGCYARAAAEPPGARRGGMLKYTIICGRMQIVSQIIRTFTAEFRRGVITVDKSIT